MEENKPSGKDKIKVLIVDDSAVVRQTLTEILDSDPLIEVIGVARDPFVAAERLRNVLPDVITLDIEMPRMDGITFLRKLMAQHPIPVVVCSSLTQTNAQTTLQALECGAVEVIEKPRVGTKSFLQESRIRICDAVRAAAQVKLHPKRINKIEEKLTADVIIPKAKATAMAETTDKVVLIGASTGGTEALRILLEELPPDAPGIVIVQHMPEKFTSAFAKRIDSLCRVEVKEAENGDAVLTGRALIAPGNRHTLLKRSGARLLCRNKRRTSGCPS